jgi:hypothetical protein
MSDPEGTHSLVKSGVPKGIRPSSAQRLITALWRSIAAARRVFSAPSNASMA